MFFHHFPIFSFTKRNNVYLFNHYRWDKLLLTWIPMADKMMGVRERELRSCKFKYLFEAFPVPHCSVASCTFIVFVYEEMRMLTQWWKCDELCWFSGNHLPMFEKSLPFNPIYFAVCWAIFPHQKSEFHLSQHLPCSSIKHIIR